MTAPLSVNISQDTEHHLRRVMERDDLSVTDAVGRLIQLGGEIDRYYFDEDCAIEVRPPRRPPFALTLLRWKGSRA